MLPCPLCGEARALRLLERPDRLGRETFSYFRCPRCGLIRLEPRPACELLVRYYPATYEAYQEIVEPWWQQWGRRRGWHRRIHFLQRYLPVRTGRVLDVGCATGDFLAEMQRLGWETWGLEPNPGAADCARRKLPGSRILDVLLEDADLPATFFDLITLWDVLEHVSNPVQGLAKAAGWLRPQGLLAVGIPHLESYDARLFGHHWVGWDAPRHLFLFPRATLRTLASQAGLEEVAHGCLYGDYGAFLLSLETALQARGWEKALGIARLRVWRYLLWPYFRLSELCDRGPVCTYLFRPSAHPAVRGG
ncbi:MAG: class I SAM-dependent methyltransferase [Chloroflexia bacterium]